MRAVLDRLVYRLCHASTHSYCSIPIEKPRTTTLVKSLKFPSLPQKYALQTWIHSVPNYWARAWDSTSRKCYTSNPISQYLFRIDVSRKNYQPPYYWQSHFKWFVFSFSTTACWFAPSTSWCPPLWVSCALTLSCWCVYFPHDFAARFN